MGRRKSVSPCFSGTSFEHGLCREGRIPLDCYFVLGVWSVIKRSRPAFMSLVFAGSLIIVSQPLRPRLAFSWVGASLRFRRPCL